MFELISHYQGKLVCAAIVLIIICLGQCRQVNEQVNRINAENSASPNKARLPSAPVVLLLLAAALLVVTIVLPL